MKQTHNQIIKRLESETELKLMEQDIKYKKLRSFLVEVYGESGVQEVEKKIAKESCDCHNKGMLCSSSARKSWINP